VARAVMRRKSRTVDPVGRHGVSLSRITFFLLTKIEPDTGFGSTGLGRSL